MTTMRGRRLGLLALLPLSAMASPIGSEGARLLLMRTGFGAPPAQVQALAGLSRSAAVDRLLADGRDTATLAPPDCVYRPPAFPGKHLPDAERKDMLAQEAGCRQQLRVWWLQEMYSTPSPLTEKMTLFWHNHFVSGDRKVRLAQLTYQQNVLLRREALGSFSQLLHGIAKDPAMMRYLDSATNRKGQPNENFAREVMELFTLGEGHYSEQDVREAARAFTGWSLAPGTMTFMLAPRQQDTGSKTVLGKTVHDGEEVLDILLQQAETSRFITRKLWRYLVSPTPDETQVTRLASDFARDYQIKPLVRALLLIPAFWRSSGQQVKSPVELSIGTLKTFDIAVQDFTGLAQLNRSLGQDLFDPPNVKGWPGGTAWVNSDSLVKRKQFLDRLSRPRPNSSMTVSTAAKGLQSLSIAADDWLQRYPEAPNWLLAVPAVNPAATTAAADQQLRSLLLDPAYQVQ